jgi:hypothetical protein
LDKGGRDERGASTYLYCMIPIQQVFWP